MAHTRSKMLLAALAAIALAAAQSCPPEGFDSAPGFSLAKFIEKPWYVQAQLPLLYQPVSDLFCVRAIYKPLDAANLQKGVNVCNYANRAKVNGTPLGTCLAPGAGGQGPPFDLNAKPAAPKGSNPETEASKLVVGPAFILDSLPTRASTRFPAFPGLPRFVGPYWVVAFAEDYSWAIISGGPASMPSGTAGLCLPPKRTDDGLWLFSRDQVASEAAMAEMAAAAAKLSLDISRLSKVPQEGCNYAGALP